MATRPDLHNKRTFFRYPLLLVAVIIILLFFSPYLLSTVTKTALSILDGFQVRANWLNTAELISASPRLQFQFSQSIEAAMVSASFYSVPEIEGTWTWQEGDLATWQPKYPFTAGQMLRFGFRDVGDQNDASYQKLKAVDWQAFIREPEIVFLKGVAEGKELFIMTPALPDAEIQLTQSGGAIVDFTVSPDGEQILFSRMNGKNGIDLWLMDRDGQGQNLLMDCGVDRCTAPDWNPVRDEIIFSLQSAQGIGSGMDWDLPRPYLLNLISGTSIPFLEDHTKPGYDSIWSSRGQWVSVWEGMDQGVVVMHANSKEIGFRDPTSEDTGCWSPEERYFYYSDVKEEGLPIVSIIYQVDILTGLRDYYTGSELFDLGFNYYYPVCHPGGQGLLTAVQVDPKIPQRELWWIQKDGSYQVISSDLSQMVTQFSWHPNGKQVLFLRDTLAGLGDGSQMLIWDPNEDEEDKHEMLPLADQVFNLRWLP